MVFNNTGLLLEVTLVYYWKHWFPKHLNSTKSQLYLGTTAALVPEENSKNDELAD